MHRSPQWISPKRDGSLNINVEICIHFLVASPWHVRASYRRLVEGEDHQNESWLGGYHMEKLKLVSI